MYFACVLFYKISCNVGYIMLLCYSQTFLRDNQTTENEFK